MGREKSGLILFTWFGPPVEIRKPQEKLVSSRERLSSGADRYNSRQGYLEIHGTPPHGDI